MMLHVQRCTSRDNSNTYSSSELCFTSFEFFCPCCEEIETIERDMDVGCRWFVCCDSVFHLGHARAQLRSHQRPWIGVRLALWLVISMVCSVECNVFAFHFCVRFLRSLRKRWTCRSAACAAFFSLPVLFLWFQIDFNITNGTAKQHLASPISSIASKSFHSKIAFSTCSLHDVRSYHRVRFYYFYIHIVVSNRHEDDCVWKSNARNSVRERGTTERAKIRDTIVVSRFTITSDALRTNGLGLRAWKIVTAGKYRFHFSVLLREHWDEKLTDS